MHQLNPSSAGARHGRRVPVSVVASLVCVSLSLISLRSPAAVDDVGAVGSSSAVESPSPENSEDLVRKVEVETLGSYPYSPWRRFKEGTSLLLDKQNLWFLGGGIVAVAGARALDSEAKNYFAGQRRIGDIHKLGDEVLGTGVPGTLLGAGLWLYGDLNNQWYEVHAGQAMLETLLATGVVTAILKGAVGRERPDGSDHFSFPSGHTSTVFATAIVLQEFYGWKAGVPAFLLGTLTAVGRMQSNRHWLSDTVAGATLGVVIGHAFSRAHLSRFESNQAMTKRKTVKIDIAPMFKNGGGGLLFKASF